MTDRADEIAREIADAHLAGNDSQIDAIVEDTAAALREIEAERDQFREHAISLTADCYKANGQIDGLEAERDQFREKWEAAADAAIRRQGEIDRLNGLFRAETAARHRSEDRARQTEAELVAMRDERDAARAEHKRFAEALNDSHDVPPDHDSEPVPFHKGWELAVRRISACLSSPTPEGGGG